MPRDAEPPTSPPSNHRLNGWKEIAAYLGKGVRTVQRWEKEYGLPVRRLGKGSSEIVFAVREELDGWQRPVEAERGTEPVELDRTTRPNQGGATGTLMTAATPGDATSKGPTDAGASPSLLRRRPAFIAVTLVVAVTVVVWWAATALPGSAPGVANPGTTASAAVPQPASYRVDLDTLIVLDSEEREVWRHRFPYDLTVSAYSATSPRAVRLGAVSDIDGDGAREVLFITLASQGFVHHRLYCFNHDGSLRWDVQHTGRVRFGGVDYDGPFGASAVFVTRDGSGRSRVWLSSTDAMFPSVLERLDPASGRAISEYWSNGHIGVLVETTLGSRRVLLVGSSNNETHGAALVELDPDNPNGATPAEKLHYRCESCPAGGPLAFVVLPKPPRFRRSDQAMAVEALAPTAQETLRVAVTEDRAMDEADQHASGLYNLDDQLRPLSFDVASDYGLASAAIARRLGTPVPTGDPRAEHTFILSWNGSRFVALRIPQAVGQR